MIGRMVKYNCGKKKIRVRDDIRGADVLKEFGNEIWRPAVVVSELELGTLDLSIMLAIDDGAGVDFTGQEQSLGIVRRSGVVKGVKPGMFLELEETPAAFIASQIKSEEKDEGSEDKGSQAGEESGDSDPGQADAASNGESEGTGTEAEQTHNSPA